MEIEKKRAKSHDFLLNLQQEYFSIQDRETNCTNKCTVDVITHMRKVMGLTFLKISKATKDLAKDHDKGLKLNDITNV